MAAGAAVFGAFRHGVSLCPDNVIAQIPALAAQRKCQHPRYADQILWFTVPYRPGERNALSVASLRIFGIAGAAFTVRAAIAVRDIYPECSIRAQHTPYLTENCRQPRYVFLRGILAPDLRVHAVVPQAVIRWRGDAAMYAFIGQGFQHGQTVAAKNGVKWQRHTPFTSLGLVDMMR